MKKIKKKALAVMAVVGLLTGSMAVLAAPDDGKDTPEEPVYESADENDGGVLCDDGYVEYIEYPGADELVGMEPTIGEVAYPDSAGVINGWSIATGHSATSTSFKAYNGGSITVNVTISPVTSTVKVGIVQPDGTRRYVSCAGGVSHSFSLSQSGKYKVYVENNSGVTVTVSGGYSY